MFQPKTTVRLIDATDASAQIIASLTISLSVLLASPVIASPQVGSVAVLNMNEAYQTHSKTSTLLTSSEYTITPGDIISLTVVDNPTLCVPQVTVTPTGTLSLPLIGSVVTTGKTLDQLNSLLNSRYSDYLVNPAVSVSLLTKHLDYVYVTGFVQKPGQIVFQPPMNVLSAVAQADGAASNGNLQHVVVTHIDNSSNTYDLSNPDVTNGLGTGSLLSPNDVIYVPDQHDEVQVVGEVAHPSTVTFQDKMTVLDALTAAGGVLDTADLSNSILTHNGKDIPLNLQALLHEGDDSHNVYLTAGDRILVPLIPHRSFVYGAVQKPGLYTVRPGDHILDALNYVGGPIANSSLSHVRYVHREQNGTQSVRELDVLNYLKTGKGTANVELTQGDIIYVPDPKKHFQLNDLYSLLNGAELVNLGARAVSKGPGN